MNSEHRAATTPPLVLALCYPPERGDLVFGFEGVGCALPHRDGRHDELLLVADDLEEPAQKLTRSGTRPGKRSLLQPRHPTEQGTVGLQHFTRSTHTSMQIAPAAPQRESELGYPR